MHFLNNVFNISRNCTNFEWVRYYADKTKYYYCFWWSENLEGVQQYTTTNFPKYYDQVSIGFITSRNGTLRGTPPAVTLGMPVESLTSTAPNATTTLPTTTIQVTTPTSTSGTSPTTANLINSQKSTIPAAATEAPSATTLVSSTTVLTQTTRSATTTLARDFFRLVAGQERILRTVWPIGCGIAPILVLNQSATVIACICLFIILLFFLCFLLLLCTSLFLYPSRQRKHTLSATETSSEYRWGAVGATGSSMDPRIPKSEALSDSSATKVNGHRLQFLRRSSPLNKIPATPPTASEQSRGGLSEPTHPDLLERHLREQDRDHQPSGSTSSKDLFQPTPVNLL